MSNLKDQLVRLGSTNPQLRPHIRKVMDALPDTKVVAHYIQGTVMLNASQKRKINKDMHRHGLDGNGRFPSMSRALSKIWEILEGHDTSLLDGAFDTYAYTRGSGHHTEDICKPLDKYGDEGLEITNSRLVIQWDTKKETKNVEVIAYVS